MFEGVGGGEFPTTLCRIVYSLDVGVCYTRGARSRRWCGWWGRRGRWGGTNRSYSMDGKKNNEVISTNCVVVVFITLLWQISFVGGIYNNC